MVLKTTVPLDKCSACGRGPVIEQGVDSSDEPVALCEACSELADKR